jgi:hypothetical protein
VLDYWIITCYADCQRKRPPHTEEEFIIQKKVRKKELRSGTAAGGHYRNFEVDSLQMPKRIANKPAKNRKCLLPEFYVYDRRAAAACLSNRSSLQHSMTNVAP